MTASDRPALRPETVAVTAGRPAPVPDAPLNPPVVFASTYVGTLPTGGGERGYGRYGNPTWEALEDAIGALEGGRALTFGSGMAAIGGGLGAEFLGLNPQYPLIYLVYFLIVVSVGGLGRVTGVFFASLIIGVLDFALKKYLPQGGTLFIFALTILLLLWRPQGLFGGKAS